MRIKPTDKTQQRGYKGFIGKFNYAFNDQRGPYFLGHYKKMMPVGAIVIILSAIMGSVTLVSLAGAATLLEPPLMALAWAVKTRRETIIVIDTPKAAGYYTLLQSAYGSFKTKLEGKGAAVTEVQVISKAARETYRQALFLLEDLARAEKLSENFHNDEAYSLISKAIEEIKKAAGHLEELDQEEKQSITRGAQPKQSQLETATAELRDAVEESRENLEMTQRVQAELRNVQEGAIKTMGVKA